MVRVTYKEMLNHEPLNIYKDNLSDIFFASFIGGCLFSLMSVYISITFYEQLGHLLLGFAVIFLGSSMNVIFKKKIHDPLFACLLFVIWNFYDGLFLESILATIAISVLQGMIFTVAGFLGLYIIRGAREV